MAHSPPMARRKMLIGRQTPLFAGALIGVILLSAGTAPREAAAAGVGGTISIGVPAPVGGNIVVPVKTTAATNAYQAFNVHLIFDGTLLTPTVGGFASGGALETSGGSVFCVSTLADSGNGIIGSCVLTAGHTTAAAGTLANITLTPKAGASGCSLLHLYTYGPPDNGDGTTGTFTVNADSTVQSNTYGGDVSAGVGGGSCSLLTVTSTADSGPGSLRQTITLGNASGGAYSIVFRAGAGQQTIALLSPLPATTRQTTLDGTTQPGYVGTPLIAIDGAAGPPGGEDGLTISGNNGTVRGLAVINFAGTGHNGISITGNNNRIEASYIGVRSDGITAAGNFNGVSVQGGAGNVIGGAAPAGNVIAHNGAAGVVISGLAAAGNAIRGNAIFGNASAGIALTGGANNSLAAPVVTSAAATVTGTACANCSVDVFTDAGSQGRYFQGTVSANGSGAWSYTGPLAGPNVTATATDAAGDTSAFSAPFAIVVSALAGNGVPAFSGDGGPARNAQVSAPRGMFVDRQRDLYFADSGNSAVRFIVGISATGTISTVAGRGAGCPGQTDLVGDGCAATQAILNAPRDVWVDAAGNLYVADTGGCRVRKVTPGPDGEVNGGPGETISTIAGTGTCGFSGDGGAATAAALDQPSGITLDATYPSYGYLYIADTGNNRVRRVDGAGVITTVAGTGVAGFNGDGYAPTAELNQPRDVAVLPGTNAVYVADTLNSRIRILTGTYIATSAGTGAAGFAGDGGPALKAQLNGPEAIRLDDRWNLFIADTQNNRIRSVGFTTGTITTIIGGGTSPPPAPLLSLQLQQPAGYAAEDFAVSSTPANTTLSATAAIDPTSGLPVGGVAPTSGSCQGIVLSTMDWYLPFGVVGLIAVRKRLRWLARLVGAAVFRLGRPAIRRRALTPARRLISLQR